ncbi:hypothetical protein [Rhodomicrobium lacus]|nr:hypothetical protein [Rhodomicrobium lacus]WKW51793.1 hypothetical protein QMO75_04745 [Rhodomicrobium lacus]
MLFVNRPMQRVGSSLIQFRKRIRPPAQEVTKWFDTNHHDMVTLAVR